MVDYIDVVEGSVKTIKVIEKPTLASLGAADFSVERGAYSVFDWGAMPMEQGVTLDNTPLIIETAWAMELAERHGYKTTYEGLVMKDGAVKDLSDVMKSGGEVPVAIRMRLVNRLPLPYVADPDADNPVSMMAEEGGEGRAKVDLSGYDYSAYQDRMLDGEPVENFMIPLECIHREAGPLPDGSSFDTRSGKREIDYQAYGLPADYKPGDPLPFKVLDFSTKYEEEDAYLPPEQLRMMAGLGVEEFNNLQHMLRGVSAVYVLGAKNAGMGIGDGKIEVCATSVARGLELAVTDFMATSHETRRSIQLDDGSYVRQSKQTERNLHKVLDKEWAADVAAAKKKAKADGIADWRTLVTSEPKPLPARYFNLRNTFNRAATNRLLESAFGHGLYDQPPGIDAIAHRFYDFVKELGGR